MKMIHPITKLLGGMLLLSLMIGSVACKKCRECTATDGSGFVVAYEEKCATGPNAKNVLNEFEVEFELEWWNYTVHCDDTK